MKLENQVCTLEQAKKLKEMGVSPDSYFCYSGPKDTFYQGEGAPPIKLIRTLGLYGFYSEYNYYSAYTVAELGVMLPMDGDGIGEYYTLQDTGFLFNNDASGGDNKGFSIVPAYPESNDVDTWPNVCNAVFKTEAEARAAMLIYLLENNHTTPEGVNERLKNS